MDDDDFDLGISTTVQKESQKPANVVPCNTQKALFKLVKYVTVYSLEKHFHFTFQSA